MHSTPNQIPTTRRDFLSDAAFGFPAMAAAGLLLQDRCLGADDAPLKPIGRHFEGQAKQVLHIFLGGGLSQVD